MVDARKRIWGWYFFDWASQPYNTLLLTFIFAPYMKELLGSGTAAQTVWGYGVGLAGIASVSPCPGRTAPGAAATVNANGSPSPAGTWRTVRRGIQSPAAAGTAS